jgi:hypothetical protein
MRRAGRVGPVALPHWGGRTRRAGPVGPVRTRADQMRRPAGDALRPRLFGLGPNILPMQHGPVCHFRN